jgi:ferredoxin
VGHSAPRLLTDRVEAALDGTGLIVRGGFHPEPDDQVPDLPDGRPTRSVVLVGNAGDALWQRFVAAGPHADPLHPFDRWLNPILRNTAAALGAHAVLPSKGPPFVPIQRWAARAEPVHRSPIGILIHPDYGLWHVYRAAYLFAEREPLPERAEQPSPCDSCAAKPCLRVCPADAFKPASFDARACVDHVVGPGGGNCRDRGCLARRACPVGRGYSYPAETAAFHMRAMTRAVQAGFGIAPKGDSA